MNSYLLVVNAGSSSIKFTVYSVDYLSEQQIVEATGQIEGINTQLNFVVKNVEGSVLATPDLSASGVHDHKAAIDLMMGWLQDYFSKVTLLAVGHRVVHGGPHYFAPVLIDENVLIELEKLIPLAPLHQPHNLAIIRELLNRMPSLPQVACFDTAYHRTQPTVAQCFAIPQHLTDAGIRRYGFHGLSYEYIVSILPDLQPCFAKARIIIAHLGSGASLCAVYNGRSVATTMGFSPLDGLLMGTRCGSIDPGVLLYLMEYHHLDVRALEQLLYHESGLLGISGISSDIRQLLASQDPQAEEAIALFVYRIGREIGSLAAALGGLDALVFTGGIGENSAVIRARICNQAAWLGLELNASANELGDTCISTAASKVSAWVIATDENQMIARHTLDLIYN